MSTSGSQYEVANPKLPEPDTLLERIVQTPYVDDSWGTKSLDD